jgi:hypothetical protein
MKRGTREVILRGIRELRKWILIDSVKPNKSGRAVRISGIMFLME